MDTLDVTIKALKEQRAEKIKGLDAVADKALAEKRALTPEEQKSYDSIQKEIEGLSNQIKLAEEKNERQKAATALNYNVLGSASKGEENEINRMANRYSMKAALTGANNQGRLEGVEKEFSDQLRSEMVASGCDGMMGHSVIIPAKALANLNKRTVSLDALTATAAPNNEGSFTIQTDVMGIVDVLLPEMAIGQFPVVRFNNLRGNLQFPQAQTLPSAGWAATENASAGQQSPKFSKLNLTPKRLTAYVDYSAQLVNQSEANVGAYVNQFLVSASAILFDKACLKGGGSGEPTGIIGGTGYTTVYSGNAGFVNSNTNGAAQSWATWTNLVTGAKMVNSNNGQGYITSPIVKGRAQSTPRQSSGVEGNFILPSYNAGINGFPVVGTTNMVDTYSSGASGSLSSIIFGDYSKLATASWGGLEIGIDPYTGMKTAVTTAVLNTYVDCGMLNPAAFSVCKDVRALYL